MAAPAIRQSVPGSRAHCAGPAADRPCAAPTRSSAASRAANARRLRGSAVRPHRQRSHRRPRSARRDPCAYLLDHRRVRAPRRGRSRAGSHPASTAPTCHRPLRKAGELVGLVLVVQHEVPEYRPSDLIAVDDKHALVLNGPGTFDSDLHGRSAFVRTTGNPKQVSFPRAAVGSKIFELVRARARGTAFRAAHDSARLCRPCSLSDSRRCLVGQSGADVGFGTRLMPSRRAQFTLQLQALAALFRSWHGPCLMLRERRVWRDVMPIRRRPKANVFQPAAGHGQRYGSACGSREMRNVSQPFE